MTVPNNLPAIFPDMPRETPNVDKHGNFSALWNLGFSSLFQALQTNFKTEGIVFPPFKASNMMLIQNLYTPYVGGTYANMIANLPDISGQTIYNPDTSLSNQFIITQDASKNVIAAEWVPFAMMLTRAGNPNYSAGPPVIPAVAAALNWLCYDTVGHGLWACTTAGCTGTLPVSSPLPAAVWTQT